MCSTTTAANCIGGKRNHKNGEWYTSGGVGFLAGVLNMLWNSGICTNV